MSEIILTSSGDREASSTGMSSGHKSFDTAQELFRSYTWNITHFHTGPRHCVSALRCQDKNVGALLGQAKLFIYQGKGNNKFNDHK